MKNRITNKLPFSGRRWLYVLLAAICAAVLLISIGGVMAKYVTQISSKDTIKPALFYRDGDYIVEVPSDGTVPQIGVSGWKDGIVLELYNYDEDGVSQFDVTYQWTATINGKNITGSGKIEKDPQGTGNSAEIRIAGEKLISYGAEKGDEVSFELETGPYKVTMNATFKLTDSHIPDWTIVDMGAYALLTIHTNDYEGPITVEYDEDIFAPDSTNELMADWERTNGEGIIPQDKLKRFTTYQFRFFEEKAGTYTFNPHEGTGSSITIGP